MSKKKDANKKLRGGTRSLVLRWCRSEFKKRGGPSEIKTVRGMVSFLAGRQIGQTDAWLWLLEHKRDGISSPVHPTPKPARKPDAQFYKTDAWRALRFEALKASNGCCALCGRSQRLHGVVLHVDHIKPRSRFPDLSLDPQNLQILCEDCNLGKSNRDDTDWRVATETDRNLDAIDWRSV